MKVKKKKWLILFILIPFGIFFLIGLFSKDFFKTNKKWRTDMTLGVLNKLKSYIEEYKKSTGKYPRSLSEMKPDETIDRYNRFGKDAWMNVIIYRIEGNAIILYSKGPDGIAGTRDDIYLH